MNQVYKVKKEDLIDQIEGYPIQVVQKMVNYQIEQGNEANVAVFQINRCEIKGLGGFSWDYTKESVAFWAEVINNKNFDLFFRTFPELKNAENTVEKIDTHVYYKGVFYRGHEIIAELEKLGGINKFDLEGNRQEWYYYINPFNNYIVVAKNPDEIDLLMYSYTKKFLPKLKTEIETVVIDGKQYNKNEVLDKIKDLKNI